MKVTLLASTNFHGMPPELNDTPFVQKWVDEYNNDIDQLAEFAGRACYQSWQMPNPKTATTEGYLGNIIDQGHFSVLEHASATFYIEGVSRNLTHELIRHRHLSYSEVSQRYVDMDEYRMPTPPALRDLECEHPEHGEYVRGRNAECEERAHELYERAVFELQDRGLSRKEARQAARAILPGGTETKIVVTGNMRAWRDMLYKRWHEAADAEIRELAGIILSHLRDIAPSTFQGFPEHPFS